ncbi:MAG: PKD domain containing protein [Micromonosporaceae bacterium]|nr:PKD domain containing protein [Micromonosporaceae bacterium]
MSAVISSGASGRVRLLCLATLIIAVLAGVVPASAQSAHPGVVSDDPVSWTPHIQDGTVHAITVVGDTVVVGGTFTEVTDPTEQFRFPRPYLLAFGLRDGRISQLRADLDGPVYALAPGPRGTFYAGGAFRTVDGVPQRGVAQLRLDTGEPVPGFRAAVNWGTVTALAGHGRWLYLGGSFTAVNGTGRAGLARVDGATGAVDSGFDARLTAEGGGRVSVRDLALAPDGRRLVAVGAFARSHGLLRPQLVMLDTTRGGEDGLADWYTNAYERRCAPLFTTYLRGVDFAPDGSYLVAVTTGGRTHPDELCNTAARFEAGGTGMHRPTWVNHTGGHSLYSVAVTGPAVYVGGHELWHDNPRGRKSPGPGAVPREGIAALHPERGTALPWNPGRARGVGVQAFLATRSGLFVGSDTTRIGGAYRARIAMFPL